MDHRTYEALKSQAKSAMFDHLVKEASAADYALAAARKGLHVAGPEVGSIARSVEALKHEQQMARVARNLEKSKSRPRISTDVAGATDVAATNPQLFDAVKQRVRESMGMAESHGRRAGMHVDDFFSARQDGLHPAAIGADVAKTALKRKIIAGAIGGTGLLGAGGLMAYGLSNHN